jgi:hypothetical protein
MARPLHVLRACGSMRIVELAENGFALSCLSWMRPEGCVRDPVTVRLADRYLTLRLSIPGDVKTSYVRPSSREGLFMERYRAGGMPNSRLKARLNAASDS